MCADHIARVQRQSCLQQPTLSVLTPLQRIAGGEDDPWRANPPADRHLRSPSRTSASPSSNTSTPRVAKFLQQPPEIFPRVELGLVVDAHGRCSAQGRSSTYLDVEPHLARERCLVAQPLAAPSCPSSGAGVDIVRAVFGNK